MRSPITNGVIAVSAFFLLLIAAMTIHNSERMLSVSRMAHNGVENVSIRHPNDNLDEGMNSFPFFANYLIVKEFKHATITREALGNMSWQVLHLITGNYPVEPDAADEKNIEIFLKLL